MTKTINDLTINDFPYFYRVGIYNRVMSNKPITVTQQYEGNLVIDNPPSSHILITATLDVYASNNASRPSTYSTLIHHDISNFNGTISTDTLGVGMNWLRTSLQKIIYVYFVDDPVAKPLTLQDVLKDVSNVKNASCIIKDNNVSINAAQDISLG